METEEADWQQGSPVGWLDAGSPITGLRAPLPEPRAGWEGCSCQGEEKGSESTSVPESTSQAEAAPPWTVLKDGHHPPLYICFPSGWFPLPPLSLDTRHPTPLHCMGVKKEPPKAFIVCSRFNQQYEKSKICHKLLSWWDGPTAMSATRSTLKNKKAFLYTKNNHA